MKLSKKTLALSLFGALLLTGCNGSSSSASSSNASASSSAAVNLNGYETEERTLVINKDTIGYDWRTDDYYVPVADGAVLAFDSRQGGVMYDHFTNDYCNDEELSYLQSHSSVFFFMKAGESGLDFMDPIPHVFDVKVTYVTKDLGSYTLMLYSSVIESYGHEAYQKIGSGQAVQPVYQDLPYLGLWFTGYSTSLSGLLGIESIEIHCLLPK